LRLIDELERTAAAEASPFRAQLLKEDAARLRKLLDLARSADGPDAFMLAGRRLGWTQGDARTDELLPALVPLLEAVFDHRLAGADERDEERLRAAWLALHRLRMERLVGCLSTPPPRPE
jgi:hypothetical protein